MIEFRARLSATNFTKASQPSARLQSLLLGAVEVKKAQSDGTAVILKAAYQTSAAAKHDITGLYMAFDHSAGKGLNTADRRNFCFVYVA